MPIHPCLVPLLGPRSIILWNTHESFDSFRCLIHPPLLEGGFTGTVYTVTPQNSEDTCEASILRVLQTTEVPIDLVVMTAFQQVTPFALEICLQHGVKAIMLISVECDEGTPLYHSTVRRLHTVLSRYKLAFLGPSNFGLMRPCLSLNITYNCNTIQKGTLALVSQSGAVCTMIVDWASAHSIGFTTIVSTHPTIGIDICDFLDYLALEPHTQAVLLYVENIRNARHFISSLRAVSRLKPIIISYAPGPYAKNTRNKEVFHAAVRQAGAVCVSSIYQLLDVAQLLVTTHRVKGDRLGIITNAKSIGAIATHTAMSYGLCLPTWNTYPISAVLAPYIDNTEPNYVINLYSNATPEYYASVVKACLQDEQVDALLVVLVPHPRSQPEKTAELVIEAAAPFDTPLLACWLGETQVQLGRQKCIEHNIPSFISLENALSALHVVVCFQKNQKTLWHISTVLSSEYSSSVDIAGAQLLLEGILLEHRTQCTPIEARALLQCFHIKVLPALVVRSASEALATAECVGLPIALRISCLPGKDFVPCEKMSVVVQHIEEVRHAYYALQHYVTDSQHHSIIVEKIQPNSALQHYEIELFHDAIFGPVIQFGTYPSCPHSERTSIVVLPPLSEEIIQTWIHPIIHSIEISDVSLYHQVLVDMLMRVSKIACELPEMRKLSFKLALIDKESIVVHSPHVIISEHMFDGHRYGHMAIHPYPSHWVHAFQWPDGTSIVIRPIRPEDAVMVRCFVHRLSPESRFFRFMNTFQELNDDLLQRLTQLDYDREVALIATTQEGNEEKELGVARYTSLPDGCTAEFALVVADDWQGKGLGSRLMHCLIEASREKGFHTLRGEVLANNVKMLSLMKHMRFEIKIEPDDPTRVLVEKIL